MRNRFSIFVIGGYCISSRLMNTGHLQASAYIHSMRPASQSFPCVQSSHRIWGLSDTISKRYNERYPVYLGSSLNAGGDVVEAEDLESLQKLFNKYCDSEGLMTKLSVMGVPAIAQLLTDGDLLVEEFSDIWEKAPKFPDVGAAEERIDVDSFVQVYRDIDDLFEDEDEEQEPSANASSDDTTSSTEDSSESSVDDEEDVEKDDSMEEELASIFGTICDKDNLLSKPSLKAWGEVSKLLQEGLLGEDEFEDLWSRTKKPPGSADRLDVDGFLSFNVALDSLFDFDDDDVDEDNDDETETAESLVTDAPKAMIQGDGLPVSALFSSLIGADGKVGREELKYWTELQEMLADGDLLALELDTLFAKAGEGSARLSESQFEMLYDSIDDLFDEEDEYNGDEAGESTELSRAFALRSELFDVLRDLEDPDLLPCGLDAEDIEKKEILSIVDDLEKEPTNLVRQRQGDIDPQDLNGCWELLYSSSSAMKFNKGLSGLGGSFPNGRFGGLKQILKSTKFLSDVEYLERIDVKPSTASFDVRVTGNWELRKSVSLFTGEPSIVLTIEPGMVTYGPTSTRADHWKSLGPMNMLDITYLDDDLRIMRGNTAVETIFIFRRASE